MTDAEAQSAPPSAPVEEQPQPDRKIIGFDLSLMFVVQYLSNSCCSHRSPRHREMVQRAQWIWLYQQVPCYVLECGFV
ncbi:unnamed protein product [Coregonus sp. 'balchen']|nr:unnamed protein product [Coregonus sp. 'balchen']